MAELGHLGIGWGKARIGVAVSNSRTLSAYPVEMVHSDGSEPKRPRELIEEHEPELVYVGLSLTLSGERSLAAQFMVGRASLLAAVVLSVPPRLVDERMSTAGASCSLGGVGRDSRQQRRIIDQAVAVEILQRVLDLETASGRLAGKSLEQEDP